MVVGLILLSSVIAAICGGVVLFFGGSFMDALGVYVLTGMAATIAIALRALFLAAKPPASKCDRDFIHQAAGSGAVGR
ncbi:MAG: hypothetical protein ACK5JR_17995 [Tropicimonas sp.]|uniref:hypothetical protein n=1 Tax=Tropicimonas sp. TaxID=2067044 RepID=UPI003A86CA06